MIMAIIAALVIGAFIGYTTAAVLSMAKNEPKPPKENTKLWTVGAEARWNGDVYEIERFETDSENQTYAVLADSRLRVSVPVEELEEIK